MQSLGTKGQESKESRDARTKRLMHVGAVTES